MKKMKPLFHINIFFQTIILICLILVIFLFSLSLPIYAQEKLPIKVLRIQFFPLVNGRLDPTKTGMNLTYDEIVAKTNTVTQETERILEEGTRYHGYKDPLASQYLDYQVIETKEYLTPIPRSNNQIPWNPGWYRPDYYKILSDLNICDYVVNRGVKQVWMWGYHYGDIEPSESNMAGPYGDISNSERIDDMPICSKTYVLYNYNYKGSVESAVEDHMHQFEKVFEYMDNSLFWEKFVRPYGSNSSINNCGWTHMPPNTITQYDYYNTTSLQTRCEDWHPDLTGIVKTADCSLWGCTRGGFFLWWIQNIPGKNHNLYYQGNLLRNWWDAIFDFDLYLQGGKSLVYLPEPTNTPTPTLTPTPTTVDPTITPTRTPTITTTPTVVNPTITPTTLIPTITPTRTPTPTIIAPTSTNTPTSTPTSQPTATNTIAPSDPCRAAATSQINFSFGVNNVKNIIVFNNAGGVNIKAELKNQGCFIEFKGLQVISESAGATLKLKNPLNLPPGTYNISVSTSRSLTQQFNNIFLNNNVNLDCTTQINPLPNECGEFKNQSSDKLLIVGDANGDHFIDILDYEIYRQNVGLFSTLNNADFNYDGQVTFNSGINDDLQVLKENFGRLAIPPS